ncbi:hypothetical protein KKE26_00780 [bacterium]|nr:hypothetical protein [bacterium]MBU1754110.1 hypothetical protein [bacterium]
MYMFKTMLSITLALCCVACSSTQKNSDIDQYWSTFRQAVLDNNRNKVICMTRFPFEVRGPDDSDPVKHYSRKEFLVIYGRLLAQSELLPSGEKDVWKWKSMRRLIIENNKIPPEDRLSPDFIRFYQFHQFEFQRIKGRWFFTRAYLEE